MTNPPEDDAFQALRRYARDLERQVPEADARLVAARAVTSVPQGRRPRRAVVAVATAGILTLSNVALAAAADPSVPGDLLYGVDRAYERIEALVGLDEHHARERLEEASQLVDRGRSADALALVEEAIGAGGPADDLAELRQLIEGSAPEDGDRQPGGPPEGSSSPVADEVRGVVEAAQSSGDQAERLREMEEALAELRRAIRDRTPVGPPDGVGPPDEVPASPGPPDDPPGQSDDPPGQSDDPPGQSDDPPGQSGDPPGQSDDPPGEHGNPPSDTPGDTSPGGGRP